MVETNIEEKTDIKAKGNHEQLNIKMEEIIKDFNDFKTRISNFETKLDINIEENKKALETIGADKDKQTEEFAEFKKSFEEVRPDDDTNTKDEDDGVDFNPTRNR